MCRALEVAALSRRWGESNTFTVARTTGLRKAVVGGMACCKDASDDSQSLIVGMEVDRSG